MSRAPRTKSCVCISLDYGIIEQLDDQRGIASRSAKINEILKKEFGCAD